METAAIYARKSVLTDKGESIDNQIERCKAYALIKGWDIKIYFDEDFSGKDLNRPQFQQMLKDIDAGIIQNVIFYRLDRVSRKVLDIINFIEELNKKGVGFISVSENFDTTTPMGRAMLLITAVFAQLERETIAERVRDNMFDLAKKGRWLGGVIPHGYIIKKTEMHGKKFSVLELHPEHGEIIKKVFEYCASNMTIYYLIHFLDHSPLRPHRSTNWNDSTVHRLIHNPIYCLADEDAYDYFTAQGMKVIGEREDWNGKKGVMAYNRSNYGYIKDKKEWIVAPGLHEGLIPGQLFIKAEKLLFDRSPVKTDCTKIRKGILIPNIFKCGCCGRSMLVAIGSKALKDTNEKVAYYRCASKTKTNLTSCDNTNIRTDILDATVIEKIKEIAKDTNIIEKQIENIKKKVLSSNKNIQKEKKSITNEIEKYKTKIKNLLDLLLDEAMPKNIVQEKINELQNKIQTLHTQFENLSIQGQSNNNITLNSDIVKENIIHFSEKIDTATPETKQELISSIVESIIWNKGDLEINIWGSEKKKSCIPNSLG